MSQMHAGFCLDIEGGKAVALRCGEPCDLKVCEVDIFFDVVSDTIDEVAALLISQHEVARPPIKVLGVLNDRVFATLLDIAEHDFHGLADGSILELRIGFCLLQIFHIYYPSLAVNRDAAAS